MGVGMQLRKRESKPEEIKGQQLLKIVHKEPGTLWDKLKGKLGVQESETVLENEIKDYLIKKASA